MSVVTAANLRDLRELRELIGQRFPDAVPVPRRAVESVATGIAVLDAILPGGGFPRGRLSAWAPRGGATAVLRAACQATLAAGERAVWIDGEGMIAGAFWEPGTILLRPPTRVHALRTAEVLLRSGAFALVVLAGADPEGTVQVRLSRAAHDGGSAAVALTASGAHAAVRASSRIAPEAYVWRRDPHGDPAAVDATTLDVQVLSLGWSRRARVVLPVVRHTVRTALEPGVPDRRGVRASVGARRAESPSGGSSDARRARPARRSSGRTR